MHPSFCYPMRPVSPTSVGCSFLVLSVWFHFIRRIQESAFLCSQRILSPLWNTTLFSKDWVQLGYPRFGATLVLPAALQPSPMPTISYSIRRTCSGVDPMSALASLWPLSRWLRTFWGATVLLSCYLFARACSKQDRYWIRSQLIWSIWPRTSRPWRRETRARIRIIWRMWSSGFGRCIVSCKSVYVERHAPFSLPLLRIFFVCQTIYYCLHSTTRMIYMCIILSSMSVYSGFG